MHLERGRDFVPAEKLAKRNWRALIEENAHVIRSGCRQSALGKLENRLGLLTRDTWKPVKKLIDRRAGFEIFKKRFHRNAGVLEYPRAAHFVFRPIHCRALFPIEHAGLYRWALVSAICDLVGRDRSALVARSRIVSRVMNLVTGHMSVVAQFKLSHYRHVTSLDIDGQIREGERSGECESMEQTGEHHSGRVAEVGGSRTEAKPRPKNGVARVSAAVLVMTSKVSADVVPFPTGPSSLDQHVQRCC